MRLWEWFKKGWNSDIEYAHVELFAYLPAWDESEADGEAEKLMYNEEQGKTGRP